MLRLKDINVAWIIHVFALLHAGVSLACRFGGVNDELLLTLLTMSMVLLICMKKWISIEYAASCVIAANIFGYMLGHFVAGYLQPIFGLTPGVNAIATGATTEILGWAIVLVTRLFHPKEREQKEINILSSQMQWLLAAVLLIFLLRIGFFLLFASKPFQNANIGEAISSVFSDSAALIIMLALNVIFVRWRDGNKRLDFNTPGKFLVILGFLTFVALIEVLHIGISSPEGLRAAFENQFPTLFVTSFLAATAVFCIIYMVNYVMKARSEKKKAMGMANIAEYRYFKLKNQVNPHFLFNSLNILDCLVCEEKTEQASTYIHKLASLYRYMLKTEEEELVTLEEEMNFAKRYYELLKVRFPEGLELTVDVPETYRSFHVVPCALQLLLENATKHNTVSASKPLVIRISGEDKHIRVSNEIIPKVSHSPSTGLGLQYLQQQYHDISGKSVEIEQTDKIFSVTIPLL